jgi:hypothetical protein
MHPALQRRGLLLAVGALLVLLAPTVASAAPVKLPDGGIVDKVDFERHIMGLFGRMGCNGGSCHGSFQGKGGFRLSLFGYDPEKDYFALTREVLGRRVDRANPDASLLLLKATGQVPHDGMTRFSKETWTYQLFSEWIRQGAVWNKGSGAIKSIQITPAEYAFTKVDEPGQLVVKATFEDGSVENITPFCDYRTLDDSVADVTNLGVVRSKQPGDTAVIVSYRGQVLPVRMLVPAPSPPGFKYPTIAEVNFIDREVFAKLRRMNMAPSDLASDNEFLRRVYIDTIGTLPTPKEVREFLADTRPDKRTRKIDELLAHPMHAALWATKFSDITGNNTDSLETNFIAGNQQQTRPKLSQAWHDWFRKRVAENMPYDEIVHNVLCATSRDGKPAEEYLKENRAIFEALSKGFTSPYAEKKSLDLFWRRQQAIAPDLWGQKTAAAFLGVRLECAECHKHPFDRWTQVDYRSYGNIFAGITFGVQGDATQKFRDEMTERNKNATGKQGNQNVQVREVYFGAGNTGRGGTLGALPHPETGAPLAGRALGGPEMSGKDPREALFQWMRDPKNPFFARSFSNRVWGHYFGRGIVDPVDDFSLANPASNDKLLDALAREFIASGYNIRKLERDILLSRTYQTSSTTNATNKFDKVNYAHAYVRPMMAEVFVDVLNEALGTSEAFGNDAPTGVRCIEVGASRIQQGTVSYALRIFGRPPRTLACDCERAMEPGLSQTLYTMADQSIVSRLTQAQQKRLQPLLSGKMTDDEVLDELCLATVTRLPTEKERAALHRHLAARNNRQAAFTDVLWVLINTEEFKLNH